MLMKTKHIISLTCVLLMLLSFIGCSIKPNEDFSNNTTEPTTSNTVRITFPEGYSVVQVAQKLEENGVCSFDDFIEQVNNVELLQEFNIKIPNKEERAFLLEGYIFPDTYDFYRNENPVSVIKKFLRNFNSKISEEFKSRASELGYTVDEIITLASIVQIESGGSSQSDKVASVLHNRLNSSSFPRLQCDVTAFYLKRYVKPYFSTEDYDALCLRYNTYNCKDLPAGAICNPGLKSIKSTLFPPETNYYFFVTDPQGNYYYANSWEEHQENCKVAGIY